MAGRVALPGDMGTYPSSVRARELEGVGRRAVGSVDREALDRVL
jgi:hypothetical protein